MTQELGDMGSIYNLDVKIGHPLGRFLIPCYHSSPFFLHLELVEYWTLVRRTSIFTLSTQRGSSWMPQSILSFTFPAMADLPSRTPPPSWWTWKTSGSWWPWETPPHTRWAWIIVELMYRSFKTLPGLSMSSSWIIDEGGCSLGRHPGLALGAEWILVGDRSNFLPFYWSTAFVQSGSWLARITYSTSEVKTSNSPTSGSWYIYSICRTFVSWTRYKTADGKALHWLQLKTRQQFG